MTNDNFYKVKRVAGLWLALRILTGLLATVSSAAHPLLPLEARVAAWPPAGNWGEWLYRVTVSPWLRWDADWFIRILTQGYRAGDGTTNFYPLFPWMALPLYWLGLDPGLCLLLLSSLAALFLFWAFIRLAALDLAPRQAQLALLLLATFPAAFILFAPYVESLFLLWTALALYSMRLEHWKRTALFVFLAALTRQHGIFLMIPVGWWIWETAGKSVSGLSQRVISKGLALLAAPFGVGLWTVYRLLYLKEGTLDFSNLQALIYSALLSPASNRVVPIQAILPPWQALWMAVSKAVTTPDIDILANLIVGIAFVVMLALAWPRLNTADRLYSLVITLVAFSYYTGPLHPYMGLPRHLLPALPVFIGLADAVKKPWQQKLMVASQGFGMVALIFLYVFKLWIP